MGLTYIVELILVVRLAASQSAICYQKINHSTEHYQKLSQYIITPLTQVSNIIVQPT